MSPSRPWPQPAPEETARAREILVATAHEPSAERRWNAFGRELWPAVFALLDVASDLPRLAASRAISRIRPELWPQLAAVAVEIEALQWLADNPVVPEGASPAPTFAADDDLAAAELANRHVVHVDGLVAPADHRRLMAAVNRLRQQRPGSWGPLEREAEPEVHAIFDRLLAGPAFAALTGFEAGRDEATLTLSLQDLDPRGIGWHRDLYWPKEWIGEDVFAVLYALGSDSPEKGGAFLAHHPWDNGVLVHYRREAQASILWNAAFDDGRLLHAVTGYHGADTSRHLVILQCRRCSGPPP